MSYHDMLFPFRRKCSWWTRLWHNHYGWQLARDAFGDYWCCEGCGKVVCSDDMPPEILP